MHPAYRQEKVALSTFISPVVLMQGPPSRAEASLGGTVIYRERLRGEHEAESDGLPFLNDSNRCQILQTGGEGSAAGGRKQEATILLLPPLRVSQGPYASCQANKIVKPFQDSDHKPGCQKWGVCKAVMNNKLGIG
eukprot:scaffold132758_cov15-Tisochrysis_lutea.AAC.1